jgi:chromate reductase
VSSVLRNTIDWASRPHGDSAWNGKPAAIMGATTRAIGTARAQNHLRQILVYLNMFPINQPEVLISHAMNRFDQPRNLTDVPTREPIIGLLQNLVDWAQGIGPK